MTETAATSSARLTSMPLAADDRVRRARPEEAAAWMQAQRAECPKLPKLKGGLPSAKERASTLDKYKDKLLADIETYNRNQDEKRPQRDSRTVLEGIADCLDGYYGEVQNTLGKLDGNDGAVRDLKDKVAASRQELMKARGSLH